MSDAEFRDHLDRCTPRKYRKALRDQFDPVPLVCGGQGRTGSELDGLVGVYCLTLGGCGAWLAVVGIVQFVRTFA